MTPEKFRRAQRRDAGRAVLILACTLVVLAGGVFAILSNVGG